MSYRVFIIFIFIFSCLSIFAQESMEVELNKVTLEKGQINVWIKALDNGEPVKIEKKDIQLIETFKGQTDTLKDIYSINKKVTLDSIKTTKKTILFLLDLSSNINESALSNAKKMITRVTKKYSGPKNQFYITAFNSKRVLNQRIFSKDDIEEILDHLRIGNKKADFNRILIEDIRFLKSKKGKKTLFVMGSGVNNIEGLELYENILPYDNFDITDQITNLPPDFTVFPIGIGDSILYDSLRILNNDYKSRGDNKLPENYKKILEENTTIYNTHLAQINPKNSVFRGERRSYKLLINDKSTSPYHLRLGSINNPISIQGSPDWVDWATLFASGLMLLIFILGICSTMVPFIQKKNFVRKYVSEYSQEGNVRLNDPVYNEPIIVGERIVKRCQQVVPLSTWEDIGYQCPNYPDCMDSKYLGCNGAGAPMEDNFFSRKGMFRPMNWMWYGAAGGFLAWSLIAFLNIINFQGIKNLAAKVLSSNFSSDIDLSDPSIFELYLDSLSNNLLLGIAFGTGLISMLSYIVELSDSREFSWMRIIIRTLIGALVSIIIFYAGFYFQYAGGLLNGYLSGLLTWLLFGISVGLILSIKSNIVSSRGVFGGLIASLIAYNIFIGLSNLFNNFDGAKLISLILLGAILGLVLVTVISRLENFELEFIAPKGYQNIPISKWLKNGQAIFIGKEPGSYVYIKWDDPEVEPRHAELVYENGVVYLQAMGETLLNKKILSPKSKVPLKNKDIIQLGRESNTIIRYKEKRDA